MSGEFRGDGGPLRGNGGTFREDGGLFREDGGPLREDGGPLGEERQVEEAVLWNRRRFGGAVLSGGESVICSDDYWLISDYAE